MNLSNRAKFLLFILLLILNLILRFQISPREIGSDSFEMHIMANSISEFGYAKWILNPLSFVGLYPASYASSMQFLLSGISQTTGLEMNSVIFLYTIFLGLLSMFTGYLMAGAFLNNDVFKFLSAFIFSTLPAVLTYTTWTIPTRGLFVILAPIAIYLLLKIVEIVKIRYVLLLTLFSTFLFSTHHLFYFLIPLFFSTVIIVVVFKTKKLIDIVSFKDRIVINNKIISKHLTFFISLAGFFLFFSIPFFGRKFLEVSRYSPVYITYARNIGLISIFAAGGLLYLMFKNNKNSKEWFILLSAMSITAFIFESTYMKWFLPIIAVLFACIGLFNVTNAIPKKKYALYILTVFFIAFIGVSGYYQFLHNYGEGRHIDDSAYNTGNWIKYAVNSSCISNDLLLGERVFSVSETTKFLDVSTPIDQIYGFINVNISQYERTSITSEGFYRRSYEGKDEGEITWDAVHRLWKSPYDFNITCVVENSETNGLTKWGHGGYPSKVLELAYEKDQVYDIGNIRIWSLKS